MSVIGVEGVHYRRGATAWVARGRSDLGLTDRSLLVYGTYEPSTVTAGVPAGTTLTVVNPTDSLPTSTGSITPTSPGFWRITTASTVVTDLDVHGCIKPEAANVIVRRCRLRGQPATPGVAANVYQPLADMVSSAPSSGWTLWEDCTLIPDEQGAEQYGIKGRYFNARRCIVEGVDAAQVANGSADLRGCILRPFFIADDPNQGPEGSHSDGIQFQGGPSSPTLTAIGNLFDGGMDPSGTSNLGFLVTDNAGTPGGYFIEDNWFRTRQGDGTAVNIPINLSITVTNFRVRGNRIQLGRDGYHIVARTAIRSQVQAEPNNVDLDTGGGITVQNGG